MENHYPRGSVLLCRFPYETSPDRRGPAEHFCLLAGVSSFGGNQHFALVYGTSRLDEEMLSTHAGAILSVPTRYIRIDKGHMNGSVAHFLCDRVALAPQAWLNPTFKGRFDFMRPESLTDPYRKRLHEAFTALEPMLSRASLASAKYHADTGRFGLLPDAAPLRRT